MVPNPAHPLPLLPSTGPSTLALEGGGTLPTRTVRPCKLSCAGGVGAAQPARKRAALERRGARRSVSIGPRILGLGPGPVNHDRVRALRGGRVRLARSRGSARDGT